MHNIEVSFKLDFSFRADKYGYQPKGPLFAETPPHGKSGILHIDSVDPNIKMEIWVEPKWRLERGQLAYDVTGSLLSEPEIKGIYPRDSGPLRGLITIIDIEDATFEALMTPYSDLYKSLGKHVAQNIHPTLDLLLSLLRSRYGQYWIPEHPSYYEAVAQPGNYFGELRSEWRESGTQKWSPFLPSIREQTFSVTIPYYPKEFFLSKEDWCEIETILNKPSHQPLALQYIAKVSQLLAYDDLAHAIIDAATAMELAANWYLSNDFPKLPFIQLASQRIKDLPRSSRYLSIGLMLGVRDDIIEKALAGVKERNDLVHEIKTSEKTSHSSISRIEYSKLYLDQSRRNIEKVGKQYEEAKSMVRCMLFLASKFLGFESRRPEPVEGSNMDSLKERLNQQASHQQIKS